MGRPAKHDSEQLLDAAAALVARSGPAAATMSAVAKSVGAPSGSVYHRFPDRASLLSALWLRSLTRFHTGLHEALHADPPRAAVRAAAAYVVTWSRDNPHDAAVLLAGARELGEPDWPTPAREATDQTNTAIETAITDLAHRLGAQSPTDIDRVVLAIVDIPYTLVRRHLRTEGTIPAHTPTLAAEAAEALLPHDHNNR
ncbi:TetR/AcrR family transcriptional regulator [Nocardia sp. AG03]|uniref:TetR/AcrR family transcriptional regulator n=1 Tax=Nocardia sp. AG03 TaxID=3025312 RepID=UPI002418A445|nr:TetR/AcrR family transcriptional regulator [Nocardia sp. AG03]